MEGSVRMTRYPQTNLAILLFAGGVSPSASSTSLSEDEGRPTDRNSSNDRSPRERDWLDLGVWTGTGPPQDEIELQPL